jgi:hypothetical protein
LQVQTLPAPGTPALPTSSQTTADAASEEIVVEGLRDLEAPDSAVTQKTLTSSRTGGALGSRTTYNEAKRFAACVTSGAPDKLTWLRKVIDSRTNSTWQANAQERLARLYHTCTPSSYSALYAGSVTDPYYLRGGLVIETIKRFAPNLKLTKEQTADRAVQKRFNAREIPLARFRLPVDRTYFETAICLVRMQPKLASRLALTDGPVEAVNRIEAAIVNRARVCVGNAKQVYFDATQFRFYIADAVYRWAVAARGTDSLIPD